MRRRTRNQRGGNVDGLRFSKNLNASFGTVKAVGQLMNLKSVAAAPNIKWASEEGEFYTLICVDPDSTAKSWLHWLVINCENASPESGSTLVKWAPPSPASGTHRYYFCLFSHAYKISPETPPQRGYFDIKKFASENGLVPERAVFVRAKPNQ